MSSFNSDGITTKVRGKREGSGTEFLFVPILRDPTTDPHRHRGLVLLVRDRAALVQEVARAHMHRRVWGRPQEGQVAVCIRHAPRDFGAVQRHDCGHRG